MHGDFTNCPRSWKNASGKLIKKESYVESVRQHPIRRGRDIVRTIRSSGQRRSNFQQTIKSGNEQEWFINQAGDPITLPVVELLHDVRTRWGFLVFYDEPLACPSTSKSAQHF
ncbi:hypothetical protein J3R83DRAFT_11053 [Lanmaoa asiatica]|nr:hypothetical protein J3R83DRAFT_11053 [Lanmaoa asiatica]